MKRFLLALLLTAAPVSALTHIEFVTVGDTAPGATCWVPRAYRMGKFEITNAQYADFLNAVAAISDPHGLYDEEMGTDPRGGISFNPRDHLYTTRALMAQKPVNFVSFLDAARFCNWLHHGQPAGAAGAASTEDGAYRMDADKPLAAQPRTPGARFALPSESEWKKAAYYDPVSSGAGSDDVWKYPTQSDTDPIEALATAIGGVSNPGFNIANYNNGAIWGGQTGHLADVGACAAPGHYGTFDQAGNVGEWTESKYEAQGTRRVMGGRFDSGLSLLLADNAALIQDTSAYPWSGFRVVMPLQLIEPEMVEIGTPGNAADSASGLGAVTSRYRIGRYEVLNEEWVAFLNAQDDTGAYSLWHFDMQNTPQGGIVRTGAVSTGFVYWVKPGYERMPVVHVSAVDAMRFCNWHHHGQPVRGVDTETIVGGAYDAGSANVADARLSGARWFLPTASEWVKAANFDPVNSAADAGGNADYWLTPVLTDAAPPAAACDAAGHLLSHSGPVANYAGSANWNGSTGGNVTAAGSAGPASLSPWGCADMAGNARELTEGTGTTFVRVLGGGYASPAAHLTGTLASAAPDANTAGFRLAARVLPASIATVPVSGPDTGDFRIGEYEVTNAQYAAFLIAVGAAASDPHGLYDTRMATDPRGGIAKVTLLGTTTFASRANMADKPVNFINWFAAARFCNWLHHGQPAGAGSLNHGAYQLHSSISDSDNVVTRDSTARWHLPDVLQWNTAAYYTPTGKGLFNPGNYYTYATQSDFPPIPAAATSTGGVSNPGFNVANYDNGADWNGQNGHLTTAGACGARSPWGCADMNGNVTEWTGGTFEIDGIGGIYAKRSGGTWLQNLAALTADDPAPAVNDFHITGFRVAAAAASTCDGGSLRVLSFTPQDSTHFRLTFTTRSSASYAVQSSATMTGAWTDILSNIPGTGLPQTVILTKVAGQSRLFYRVRQQ